MTPASAEKDTDITVDNAAYVTGSSARLYIEQDGVPAINFTIAGVFSDSNKTLTFKFLKADNLLVTKYNGDVEITISPDSDIFTHVLLTLTISGDVN